MAKSKYAPALFELIDTRDKRKRSLAIPKWFTRSSPAETTSPSGGSTASGQGETPAGGAPASSGPPTDGPLAPFMSIRIGTRGIGLNRFGAFLALGGLVLMVVAAFVLGQRSAARTLDPTAVAPPANKPLDDVSLALQGPPRPEVLKASGPPTVAAKAPTARDVPSATARDTGSPAAAPVPSPTGEPSAPQEPPVVREPGINYVVIETFKGDHRKSAEAIRDWLKNTQNLDTTIERVGNDRWRLVTVLGFDYKVPGHKEACQQFLAQVKALGDECARELTSRGLPVYRLTAPYAMQFNR